MIEINGKHICENCFEELTDAVCSHCGYDPKNHAVDPTLLAPGTVLANRYIVGQVIGKGGFGITYLALDAITGKKVAVKEYFPYGIAVRSADSPSISVTTEENAETFKLGAEKFIDEAGLISKFNGNPGIAGVYDAFHENGTAYFVMEYLKGQTLKAYIRDNGVLAPPQALYAARRVAGALVVVHSASVLHRDISPDNVIVCDNGNIKLIDFGAARQLVAEQTQNFSVILKPGFAPPEQYHKNGNQGSWTDVYSLGAMLYFMLTGDIPEDSMARFDNDDTFKENRFGIAPPLWEIITKAVSVSIENRYRDAYEMKCALDNVEIASEPIVAPNGEDLEENVNLIATDGRMNFAMSNRPITITVKPKKSFFKKHLRAIIEVACVAVVVAVLITVILKISGPRVDDTPSAPDQSASNNSVSAPVSSGSDEVYTPNPVAYLEENGFTAPHFSILNDKDKTLYSYIYIGLAKSEKEIIVPSLTYTVDDAMTMYQEVLWDNPQLVNVQGYSLNYTDLNNNRTADDDEYVNSIRPQYINITAKQMSDVVFEQLTARGDDTVSERIESLKYFHDKLAAETQFVPRKTTATASSAHGAIIDHAADDLGLANAMCFYAQRMGFFSFVIEREILEEMHAWVRVKIDGVWYNIDVYYDSFLPYAVTEIPVADDNYICHTFFLCGDLLMFESMGLMTTDDDPLFLSDDGTLSPHVNYYIEKHLKKDYYMAAALAYDALLEETEYQFSNGKETVYLYVSPDIVDDLCQRMNNKYLSDLSDKFGITLSEFSSEYSVDTICVTLKK